MKHVAYISREHPAEANDFQEIVVTLSKVTHDLLEAKGGNLPFVDYLYQKAGWDQVQP